MIRFFLLVAFVSISLAEQCSNPPSPSPAKNTCACKKCTSEYRLKHKFDENNNACRECIYKIYDELNLAFPEEAYRDLYCGCKFEYRPAKGHNNIRFYPDGCFENSKKAESFDDGVDLEHVFPKSRFNQDNYLSTDFHNLFPAIGMINTDRGTKEFADWDNENSTRIKYGKCETFIQGDRIYPRVEAKGMIARAYLYLADQAEKRLGMKRESLFPDSYLKQVYADWNKSFPPTPFECKREKIIQEIQGNHNPYISNHPNCKFVK